MYDELCISRLFSNNKNETAALLELWCSSQFIFWKVVTGPRCQALEDIPVAAAGFLAVSSGSFVHGLELPLGLSVM